MRNKQTANFCRYTVCSTLTYLILLLCVTYLILASVHKQPIGAENFKNTVKTPSQTPAVICVVDLLWIVEDNAVVTCEIKLFQHYFSLRRCPY